MLSRPHGILYFSFTTMMRIFTDLAIETKTSENKMKTVSKKI